MKITQARDPKQKQLFNDRSNDNNDNDDDDNNNNNIEKRADTGADTAKPYVNHYAAWG